MKGKFCLMSVVLVLLLSLVATPVLAVDVPLEGGVYDATLTLENKDASWAVKSGDGIGATLGYNLEGPDFVWGLEASGLTDGDYSLIYYADASGDRFGEWGGDNPGKVIATVTASSGNISASGTVNLDMSLPCLPDANMFEHDYSVAPDYYAHAHGAKIWLIPTSALTSGSLPVQVWPPTDDWLFETDLITYYDTDASTNVVAVALDVSAINFGVLTPGTTGDGGIVTVENAGNVPINVTAGVTGGTLFSNLLLDGGAVGAYNVPLSLFESDNVSVTLPVPSDYTPAGAELGSLTFTATAQ